MAFTGGIGQQLDQMVSANRGNPNALMERTPPSAAGGSPVSPDLLKLLALQALKAEADSKARELSLTLENQPGTIAEQRFAEAEGRALGKVTEQVTGVKANQQQNVVKRQQQMLSGRPGQRMAMAPPPQMGGVAGQPAPNMARMAGGGIVTFQEGSLVEVTDEQLKAMNVSKEVFEGLTPEGRKRLLGTIDPNSSEFRADSAASIRERVLMDAAREANISRPNPFERLSAYFAGDRARSEAIGQRGRDATRRANDLSALATQPAPGFQPPNAAPNAAPSVAPDISKMMGDLSAEGRLRMNAGPGGDFGQFGPATAAPAPAAAAPAAATVAAGVAAVAPAPNYLTNYETARTNNAAFLGRPEDKASREAMLAKTKALNSRLKQETTDNSFYDMISGIRDFTDIGVNARNQRRQNALDEERRLGNEQEIEGAQLKSYFDIGKEAITGAVSVAEGISTEKRDKITAAITKERNRVLSRGVDSTNENAIRKFQGDMLSLAVKTASADAENLQATIQNAQLTGLIPKDEPEKTAALTKIREAAAATVEIRDTRIEAQVKQILSGGLQATRASQ